MVRSRSSVVGHQIETDFGVKFAGRIDDPIGSLAEGHDVINIAVTPLVTRHDSMRSSVVTSVIVTVVWRE